MSNSDKVQIICKNFWCKAIFFVDEVKLNEFEDCICPKCKDFDQNLSGGVTSNTKTYDGPRNDGMWHPVDLKVSKWKQ